MESEVLIHLDNVSGDRPCTNSYLCNDSKNRMHSAVSFKELVSDQSSGQDNGEQGSRQSINHPQTPLHNDVAVCDYSGGGTSIASELDARHCLGRRVDPDIPTSEVKASGRESAVFSKQESQGVHSYYTVPSIVHTCPWDVRGLPRHSIGGVLSQMNVNSWNYYLQFEKDEAIKSYLWDGVLQGFSIVDSDDSIPSYYCENYSSAITGEAFSFIDKLIQTELQEGKFV